MKKKYELENQINVHRNCLVALWDLKFHQKGTPAQNPPFSPGKRDSLSSARCANSSLDLTELELCPSGRLQVFPLQFSLFTILYSAPYYLL